MAGDVDIQRLLEQTDSLEWMVRLERAADVWQELLPLLADGAFYDDHDRDAALLGRMTAALAATEPAPCQHSRWAIPVIRRPRGDGAYWYDQDYDENDAMLELYANRGHVVATAFCRDCGMSEPKEGEGE